MDRVAPPDFVDDGRPPVGRFMASRLVIGFMGAATLLGGGIIWLTGGDGAPPKPKNQMSLAAAAPAPLPGLATDYTQIPIVQPPLAEVKKEEPAPPPAAAPAPKREEPKERVVYQQGGGGGIGKNWRQEAREADGKVIEVARASGGQNASSGAPAGQGGAQQGRGSFYSTARLTAPFPLQVNARTPIRAHTKQPITTESPGYVTAMVIGDIYTSNKQCVAIPHGSRLYGETIGEVKEGQTRVTTVWTGLQRPEPRNDTIELTKVVGGEADGTPGIPGEVNNHWFRKFGFILASTAIDLGTAALQGRGDSGFAVILGDSVAQNARSPLDEFARKQLDIPPTIEVEPREVSVTLSQHLAVDCFDQR